MLSEELGSNFCWNNDTDKSLGTLGEKESWDIVFYATHYKNKGCGCIWSNAIVKEVLCRQGDQSVVMQ